MEAVATPILNGIASSSPYVAMLIMAIIWLVRRDDRMDQSAKAEAAEREKTNREREEANRLECLARERALADRLSLIENRHNAEQAQLLLRVVIALEVHGRVMEKIIDGDTGIHRAIAAAKGA